MAVFLGRKMELGHGIGGYDFQVTEQTSQDHQLYETGVQIEECLLRKELEAEAEMEEPKS